MNHIPRTSTERSQLTRLRRRRHLRVVPIEIFHTEIEWLVGNGLLAEDDRANTRKVGRAIERLIEQSTRRSN
jgi:hypothetical protein